MTDEKDAPARRCTSCGDPFAKPPRLFLPGGLAVCPKCFTPDTRAAARRPSKHETPPHTNHV